MGEELLFYKTNVPFTIGIRLSVSDRVGIVLDRRNPYVAIKPEALRDFLQANKQMIKKGYLIPSDEPQFETESINAITDEQASELVKNFFALKKKLQLIDSDGALFKLRSIALKEGRSQKTIALIDDRIAEITPVDITGIE